MPLIQVPLDQPYRELLIRFLQQVLSQPEEFWISVKEHVKEKFFNGETPVPDLAWNNSSFKNDNISTKSFAIHRLQNMVGFKFKSKEVTKIEKKSMFDADADLQSVGVRVKRMKNAFHVVAKRKRVGSVTFSRCNNMKRSIT